MFESVTQLIYVSKQSSNIKKTDFDDILETAIKFNAEHNITGMLVVVSDLFYQLLEGEEQAIVALMDKIKTDPRHHNVNVISQEQVFHRDFPSWSMNMRKFDGNDVPRILMDISKQTKVSAEMAEGIKFIFKGLSETQLA